MGETYLQLCSQQKPTMPNDKEFDRCESQDCVCS